MRKIDADALKALISGITVKAADESKAQFAQSVLNMVCKYIDSMPTVDDSDIIEELKGIISKYQTKENTT